MARHLARFRHDSTFRLHNLVIKQEDGRYIVGRKETETYVSLPQEGAQVLLLMKRGLRAEEIQRRLPDHDVPAFITAMIGHGFIHQIDHHNVIDTLHPRVRILMPWLHKHHVEWLFTFPMKAIYVLLVLLASLLLITQPTSFPTPKDFFFLDSTFLLLITTSFMGFLLVFLHELAHFIAARSLGISARFGITTRAAYLVFITDVTNLYSLPRKKRYRVMLAGPLLDLVILSLALLLGQYLGSSFWKFVALTEIMGL
ncbi:MAG: site-2 protease family protein, partial [Nitrosarchaeum sp.]|nr:site-2 protease family protein [Nitrosarchaeum sp.]